ncbi:MAG: ferrous iron transport protein B [Desulfurococcaceae archaeon]|nr:ferrous iron transport protein B [Sulfolobales archaeon]MDW8170330.1 ferrous iron transport protein B [Desulfurococcaceae archaeon]
MKEITVAVAGQPNVGKTALFNLIVGQSVEVANWPGVTVEKREGFREHKSYRIRFIDLPGTYGLTATSIDQVIARNFIISGEADVILILVDSTIPERTMYLLLEVLELTSKVVVVFTKSDMTHSAGVHINYDLLEKKVGAPIVPISIKTPDSIGSLLDKIIEVHEREPSKQLIKVDYGELEPFIRSVEEVVRESSLANEFPARWLAVKLLEGDRDLESRLLKRGEIDLLKKVRSIQGEAEEILKLTMPEAIATKRFSKVIEVLQGALIIKGMPTRGRGEHLIALLYKPWIGPLISMLLVLALFTIVFTINTGFPLNVVLESIGLRNLASYIENYSLSHLVSRCFDYLSQVTSSILSDSILRSLIVDGIINGIGIVMTFLPLIATISIVLAMLEDSGLLPVIAASMHPFLRRMGFSGHMVFPIAVSFGCNVPGVIATRASPNFGERVRAWLTIAFIPCQARLIVVLAFATALRSLNGLVLMAFAYATALLVFMAVNKSLVIMYRRRRLYEEPELLLEIPPIHAPIPRVIWWITWNQIKHFLIKAATLIFLASLASWIMLHYTSSLTYTDDYSLSIGMSIASVISPLLTPLGFNEDLAKSIGFALIAGFFAKEAVLSTIAIIADEEVPAKALNILGVNDAQLVFLTIFTMLYVPCIATLVAVYSESKSFKITLSSVALMMVTAYAISMLAYTVATALMH